MAKAISRLQMPLISGIYKRKSNKEYIMVHAIKKYSALILATFALLFGVSLVPSLTAHAAINTSNPVQSGVCSGVTGTGATSCEDDNGTGASALVKDIINILSWIIGAVSVIMIIFGGFRYIVSGGDSGQIGNAKNTIIYAIVGLVIVIFAQIIVRFVIGSVSNAAAANS
jgi:hypothetical protein